MRVAVRKYLGLVVGSTLAIAQGWWRAPPAAACSKSPPVAFQVDPSLQAVDTQPPTPFRSVRGSARQISGTHCNAKSCTSSSCGDAGSLELTFIAPQDDQSDTMQLGYRVLWLRGHMPSELHATIDEIRPLTNDHAIRIELSFQGVTELDGELALVAIDRAGNTSEPSAPVAIQFSGCMSYFDDESCAQKHACSVVRGVSSASIEVAWLPLLAAGLLGVTARLRRRSRKRLRS